jgi:hypothetical protein
MERIDAPAEIFTMTMTEQEQGQATVFHQRPLRHSNPALRTCGAEFINGAWHMPEDGTDPVAVIEPDELGSGWCWWTLGRMGFKPTYLEARIMADEELKRIADSILGRSQQSPRSGITDITNQRNTP